MNSFLSLVSNHREALIWRKYDCLRKSSLACLTDNWVLEGQSELFILCESFNALNLDVYLDALVSRIP